MCPPSAKRQKPSTKEHIDHRSEVEEETTVQQLPPTKDFEEVIPEMERMGRFIGAHVSAAGGLHNAFTNSKKIGGTALALFLKSQRQWAAKPLEPEAVVGFKETCKELGFDMSKVLPHGSYLVNLGNPDGEKRAKSYEAFLDELKRCDELGVKLYNFHPGSTVGACTPAESIKLIAECINAAQKATQRVIIVIENMAGQGNVIGGKFEHLRDIIALVQDKSRVGICLDTCHTFAAGYDLRSEKAYAKTMAEFDRIVGMQYLKALHLNDSKTELGSGKDRHENIGKGHVGLGAFRNIMNDERLIGIPMVLETPLDEERGDEVYKEEIKLLYSLIKKKE